MIDQEETEKPCCPLCLETIDGVEEVNHGDSFNCSFCWSDLTTVEVGNETVILVKQV